MTDKKNNTGAAEEAVKAGIEEEVMNAEDEKEAASQEQNESEEDSALSEGGEPKEAPEEPKEDADERYMRLSADFQNFKRRVEKEKADIYQYANEKIALDMVEVMDNFERALDAECSDKKFADGVVLIYRQLKGVLDKNNILEIPAENQEFDPNFHNAVMTEANPDFESGIVIQVLQKGYTLNGKVIRPSMVKVSQ